MVGGKALIEYHIERLCAAGNHRIVINTGRPVQQFEDKLVNGKRYDVNLVDSHEVHNPL